MKSSRMGFVVAMAMMLIIFGNYSDEAEDFVTCFKRCMVRCNNLIPENCEPDCQITCVERSRPPRAAKFTMVEG